MNIIRTLYFLFLVSLMFTLFACKEQNTSQKTEQETKPLQTTQNSTVSVSDLICPAEKVWVMDPSNPPKEIPLGKNAKLCQFYQFSWQWFIALMAEDNDNLRIYQIQANYPNLNKAIDSCTAKASPPTIYVRTQKNNNGPEDDFILPEDIHQAAGNATIYDQNGNVVFYEIRFDRTTCNVAETAKMFPAGTTELKVSWRVIEQDQKSQYVWINADINADGKIEAQELLGMVGFHFVKSTEYHPEFIWATFEHKDNAPDCQSKALKKNWSFTSASCTGQLPNSVDPTLCNLNAADDRADLKGNPSEICQVYHAGTAPGDNQAATNLANIDSINEQLTGDTGFLTQLSDTNPLKVLANYKVVGALWENDVQLPSTNLDNQRGSIQLTNTTMETTVQQGFNGPSYTGPSHLKPAANCFACHGYTPANNITLSHIFGEIHGPKKR